MVAASPSLVRPRLQLGENYLIGAPKHRQNCSCPHFIRVRQLATSFFAFDIARGAPPSSLLPFQSEALRFSLHAEPRRPEPSLRRFGVAFVIRRPDVRVVAPSSGSYAREAMAQPKSSVSGRDSSRDFAALHSGVEVPGLPDSSQVKHTSGGLAVLHSCDEIPGALGLPRPLDVALEHGFGSGARPSHLGENKLKKVRARSLELVGWTVKSLWPAVPCPHVG